MPKYVGKWKLPVLGAVTAPTVVLFRPDGYVGWVGDATRAAPPADHAPSARRARGDAECPCAPPARHGSDGAAPGAPLIFLAAPPGGDQPRARIERHAVLVAVVGREHLAQAPDGACRLAIAQAREGRTRVLNPVTTASAASRSVRRGPARGPPRSGRRQSRRSRGSARSLRHPQARMDPRPVALAAPRSR